MALIGLEFDVLCNPFAPTLILHWVMSSHGDSHPTPASDPRESDRSELINVGTGSAESCPDAENPSPTAAQSQFSITPEIAEAIAVRPPARSSFLVVAGAFFLVSPPLVEIIAQSREPRYPITTNVSIQTQLCRFRC